MNQKVLSVFKTNETQLSASEIVKLTGLKKNDVVKALTDLKQTGQLKFVGGGKWRLA